MFERASQTWEIMKCCVGVLKKDKELMVFPILSAVSLVLVMASWFAPLAMSKSLLAGMVDTHGNFTVTAWVYLFLFYFSSTFVIVFFNTAVVSCALQRLQGGDPTVGYGVREAGKRLHLIFGWSLLSGTVGLILKIIEERFALLGRIISSILGTLWALVTFFAIPVLVAQNLGPLDTLKESGRLFRERWGEQIIGNFSFGLLGFLAALPFWVAIFFGLFAQSQMRILLLGVGILGVIAVTLVQSVLASIFQAALYLYARDGIIGDGFTEDDLSLAVKTFE